MASFLSQSNKMGAYNTNLRNLASQLRISSTQNNNISSAASVTRNQIQPEPAQIVQSNVNKLITSSPYFNEQIIHKSMDMTISSVETMKLKFNERKNDRPIEFEPKTPKIEVKAVHCPESMSKKLHDLFPNKIFDDITVLNTTQKTQNDMSSWGATVEIEWSIASSNFTQSAIKACKMLRTLGYWTDFIDPLTSKPYLSSETTEATLEVTDNEFNSLGFDVTDMGCCKILSHKLWGSNIFVGTIFTDAPINAPIIGRMVSPAK